MYVIIVILQLQISKQQPPVINSLSMEGFAAIVNSHHHTLTSHIQVVSNFILIRESHSDFWLKFCVAVTHVIAGGISP